MRPLEARVRADVAFLSGGPHAESPIEHFVGRSVVFDLWLRKQAVALGLPRLDLKGVETPDEVARYLDALRRPEASD